LDVVGEISWSETVQMIVTISQVKLVTM